MSSIRRPLDEDSLTADQPRVEPVRDVTMVSINHSPPPPKDPSVVSFIKSSTLYFYPGDELDCENQFNYVCKFWFSVRCHLLSSFPSISILAYNASNIHRLVPILKPHDVVLFSWRHFNHLELPPELTTLLALRANASHTDPLKKTRIGMLHIANELDRRSFHWYPTLDFIARNYWIEYLPKHVKYMPLPPQYPFGCSPNTMPSFSKSSSSSESGSETDQDQSSWLVTSSIEDSCTCDAESDPIIKASYVPASKRRYLWTFSGSLRENRGPFVDRLRADMDLAGLGDVQIANGFGGDGEFGTNDSAKSPKTKYLQLIADSAFVFAPCGNVMETHRIYEAVALGAIPVIENCTPNDSLFFPLRKLVVGNGNLDDDKGEYSHTAMRDFVREFLKEEREGSKKKMVRRAHQIDQLQGEVIQWWEQYVKDLGRNMSTLVNTVVPSQKREEI